MSGRPFVISIAGFDPTAGAGVLSDLKTFEAHRVYGFGVCSALTVQSDTEFLKNQWLDAGQVIDQLQPLLQKFPIGAVKIGLIKDLDSLNEILDNLKTHTPGAKIVLDPILSASAGYKFHKWDSEQVKFKTALKRLNLITPNYPEMQALYEHSADHGQDINETCKTWSADCTVLLKGGHTPKNPGRDFLFEKQHCTTLDPGTSQVYQKHGSGCVLSSAIVANLALGYSVLESCRLAKVYIEQFLNSNPSLLGYHNS